MWAYGCAFGGNAPIRLLTILSLFKMEESHSNVFFLADAMYNVF